MQNNDGLYVILASGFSRRYGRPKLLEQLSNGFSIIESTVHALHDSGSNYLVVIREGDADLEGHLSWIRPRIMRVSNSPKGLSSVIAECATKLDGDEYPWLGICLGDMPYIASQTFAKLSKSASTASIVRPRFQNRFGHPVLFGKEFFSDLGNLTGDDGAKSVLQSNPNKLVTVDVDDPMILHDIDTPRDII